MDKYYTIAVNVGETFTKSVVMDERGKVLPDSIAIFPTKVSTLNETILENIVQIIKFTIHSILHPQFKIKWIGFSFTRALLQNGEDLINTHRLKNALNQDTSIRGKISKDCIFHYESETRLFAIGEHALRKKDRQANRVLYLILDTSFSYAFSVNGQLIEEFELDSKEKVCKKLERKLLAGNKEAINSCEIFGQNLALNLTNKMDELLPDEIIIGGNLYFYYTFYSQNFEKNLKRKNILVKPTRHTSYYILLGLSEHIRKESLKLEKD